MGNNNSYKSQSSSIDVVRQPPSRPNAPPSSRPVSELGPHGPSYHNPDNQVLPRELPSMIKLRPVSMELSKYNPDYENIFASQHIDSLDRNENNNIYNSSGSDTSKPNSLSTAPPPLVENGKIPITQMNISLSPPPSSTMPNGYITLPAKAPYRPSHRRQMSLVQEHTIIEEPEENIDNRVKLDPLMQSYPGAVAPSLPVKNNFNLDYSYQLTYVQLAEHRRNKTIDELEKKTGKKISDLSADLNEHTVTDYTFTPGAASSASSKSDCTGGSAMSSKKKKAPAPPSQRPKSSVFQTTNSDGKVQVAGKNYMVDSEPPIDYDIESPKKTAAIKLSRHLSAPNVSKMEPSKAPTVSLVKLPAFKNQGAIISRSNSMSSGTPQIILKKAPDVKAGPKISDSAGGPIPWLQEIKTLSETRAAKRQQSATNVHILEITKDNTVDENENNKKLEDKYETEVEVAIQPKLVFQSSTAEFVPEMSQLKVNTSITNEVTQLGNTVERCNSLSEQVKSSSPKLKRHYSASVYDHPTPSELQHQTSFSERPTSGDQIRRLNSLLLHDIKAAANAKCVKLVKKSTPTPPKPKDSHTVFREQLEKACAARNERAKVEGTIDEKRQNISSNANFNSEQIDTHAKSNFEINSFTPTLENDIMTSNEPPKTLSKPQRYVKNIAVNHKSSSQDFGQRTMKNSDERQRNIDFEDIQTCTSLDWTPEVDLDSDDNLSDREDVTSKKTASNGFKSTVIPNAMLDLKAKKNGKKEKQNKYNENNSKNKMGSVKKFKKSVHNGVKNAFGSISKTTGKLLGRHKSEEFEVEEEPIRNWNLAANSGCSSMSVDMSNHRISNGNTAVDDVSNLNIEIYETNELFNVGNENADVTSEEDGIDYDDDDESNIKSLQTGQNTDVVNVSADHKTILKSNSEAKYDESIESYNTEYSKRAKEMKKKYAFEGTAGRKQTDVLGKKALKDAREKERMIEAERRKQLEKELEMHKIREAETIARLKRLEEAQLQQQLNVQLLQQQTQQQHMGILTAPQLPTAGNFQFYSSLPDATQLPSYSNPFGQQLPPSAYQPNFGLYSQTPFLNGSTAAHVPFDLNDYMRMLGMTSLPASQQMAFLLNSMTYTGQPFDRKSNPIMFDVFNQHCPTGTINYQGLDTNGLKKQNFQNWVSTPNIHTAGTANDNNVSLTNFVANYNVANNTNDEEAEMTITPRNPLYDSDGSDDGLSPQMSLVSAQVKDYGPIPGNYISESNNFDSQSFSETSQNMFNPNQQKFVSPSNSVGTDDSAITSTSTPSSPSLGAPSSPTLTPRLIKAPSGFRTIIEL